MNVLLFIQMKKICFINDIHNLVIADISMIAHPCNQQKQTRLAWLYACTDVYIENSTIPIRKHNPPLTPCGDDLT